MSRRAAFSLDQLEALDAVVSHGSFRAAGEALGRVTSAVSYAVRTLEEAVGFAIFDRSGHRAVLTTAGAAFLLEARALLERAAELSRYAEQLERGWEPELALVVDGVLPLGPVMRALSRMSREAVPTKVEVVVEYLGGVYERFEQHRADLMMALDFPGHPDFESAAMEPLTMWLLARADHPLAALDVVTREDLRQHVELVVADSAPRLSALRRHLRPHRLRLGSPHIVRLSDFLSKREAILGGVGFGWLPTHLVDDAVTRGELVRLPFDEGGDFTFAPRLVWRRAPKPGPATRLIRRLLDEELAGGGAVRPARVTNESI